MPGSAQRLSSYPNGFPNGLLLRGVPILQTNPGNVYWVYNGATPPPGTIAGANSAGKGTFQSPYQTIAYALTQCVANRGDIIIVKPGHAETIPDAATLSLNVAGVAIIGLGAGSLRPTLTFTTATTANIPVTAANMSIQNFLFSCGFAAVASVFTATSTNTPTDFNIENCEFVDQASNKNFVSVFTGNATANSCDGLRFVGNKVRSKGTTANTTAIVLSSATDRVEITDNFGVWAILNDTACMLAGGSNNLTNLMFGRNVLYKPNTSSTGGSFVSSSSTACTGHCFDNYLYQVDATAGIWIATGTGLGFSQNFSPITGAADKSGLINPAAV